MIKTIVAMPLVFALMALLASSLFSISASSVYATPATTTAEEEQPEAAEPEPEPETSPSVEPEPEPSPPVEPESEQQTPAAEEENAEAAITSQDDIEPCLLDPSLPSCPKPGPDQDCPEGWAQNEDGNCFPLHPQGCPNGYHGHEDDETGRCIPNSTPCDPSYILVTGENGRKNCERKESYCQTHQQNDNRCRDDNDNGKDDDHDKKVIIIKKFIKDTDIINRIDDADSNGDLDIAQTIVAINYNEGAGINCVFDDDDNGQCETFDVTKDSGKDPLLQIIDFT